MSTVSFLSLLPALPEVLAAAMKVSVSVAAPALAEIVACPVQIALPVNLVAFAEVVAGALDLRRAPGLPPLSVLGAVALNPPVPLPVAGSILLLFANLFSSAPFCTFPVFMLVSRGLSRIAVQAAGA